MLNSKVITFAEVTARAEKLKQQKEVNKEIQEAEAKKAEAIKEFIETLDDFYFGRGVTNLLTRLTRVAVTGYSVNKAKIKSETLTDTTPKAKGGATNA